MVPYDLTIDSAYVDDVDRDVIAAAQQPGAGAAFTLVGGGTVTFTHPTRVSIFSGGNESANYINITGTLKGIAVTERIAGPTANGTVYTTKYFDVVTAASCESAAGADIELGNGDTTNGQQFATYAIGVNYLETQYSYAINHSLADGTSDGAFTVNLEYTKETINRSEITFDMNKVQWNNAAAGLSEDASGTITDAPITAIRLTFTGWLSGMCKLNFFAGWY